VSQKGVGIPTNQQPLLVALTTAAFADSSQCTCRGTRQRRRRCVHAGTDRPDALFSALWSAVGMLESLASWNGELEWGVGRTTVDTASARAAASLRGTPTPCDCVRLQDGKSWEEEEGRNRSRPSPWPQRASPDREPIPLPNAAPPRFRASSSPTSRHTNNAERRGDASIGLCRALNTSARPLGPTRRCMKSGAAPRYAVGTRSLPQGITIR
jgi:hypothetical protein